MASLLPPSLRDKTFLSILTDFPVDSSHWPTGFGERRSLLRDIRAFDFRGRRAWTWRARGN
jgi:hypothetical protein